MPNALLFKVPEHCKKCHEQASVRLEHTLKGEVVLLTWCCKLCSFEWPVLPADHIERRRVAGDRSKDPLTERRKPPRSD